VSDTNAGDGASRAEQNDGGVLANLPRTRPQRSSPRRAAARGTGSGTDRARKAKRAKATTTRASGGQNGSRSDKPGGASGKPAGKTGKASATRSGGRATGAAAGAARSGAARGGARRAPSPRRRSPPPQDSAPRQGFESDGETTGGALQPPGGAEFVASAAEIVGELAKAGLSRSERLLKDVISRLPLS
jgi:hypothetical protein